MFPKTSRNHPIAVDFLSVRYNNKILDKTPISPKIKSFLQNTDMSNLEQISFSDNELLQLYEAHPQSCKSVSSLLIHADDNQHLSKGKSYFKQDSVITFDQYVDFLDSLAHAFTLTENIPNDLLKLKSQFVLIDEAINHLSWGYYIAMQAAGCRDLQSSITFDDVERFRHGLEISASQFVGWFEGRSAQLWSLSECFVDSSGDFFEEVTSNANYRKNGTYFRSREGGKEIQNILHAYKTKIATKKSNDVIIGLFYGGVSVAAILGAVLGKPAYHLVHSSHENYFKRGILNDTEQLSSQISQADQRTLPRYDFSEQDVLLVDDVVHSGKNLIGAQNFCNYFGANSVHCTTTEAGSDVTYESHMLPFEYRGLEFSVAPSFTSKGMGPWYDLEKFVANTKSSNKYIDF